jgi:hypothetical protein
VNRPGIAGDLIVRIRRPYRVCSSLHEIGLRCFSGWDISEGLKQVAMVEPVDPPECFHLDLVHSFPRATPPDHLGFVKAVDRLGQSPRQWS